MVNFNKIFENAFKDKYEILKEIKCGLRCETYLVKIRNKKYIFQIKEISKEEAMDIVYNSKTYELLCDLETHLYYESSAYVYELLKEELGNGTK